MSNGTQSNGGTNAAIVKKSSPIVAVKTTVRDYLEKKTLILPRDYAVWNALNSASLILAQTDISKCTEASVKEALLTMVVLGLNPAKKQVYLIPYGNRLVCQPSYFGDIAIAQRVRPGIEPYFAVVYQGEEFLIEINRGRMIIAKHLRKIEGVNPKRIIAAYCGFVERRILANGSIEETDLGAEIMTIDEIHTSWLKSKTYKPDATSGSFHHDQPDQACLRTVIRRRCKPIINASSDLALLSEIAKTEIGQVEAIVDAESASFAEDAETLSLPEATATVGGTETPSQSGSEAEQESEPVTVAVGGGGESKTGLPFNTQ